MLIDRAMLALTKIAQASSGRMALKQVYFERKKGETAERVATATATDGYMLVRVEEPALPEDDFPLVFAAGTETARVPFTAAVDAEQLEKIGKTIPKKASHAILCNAILAETEANKNGTVPIATTDLDCKNVFTPKKGEKGPDMDKIVDPLRAKKALMTLNFDAVLLERAFEVARACHTGGRGPLIVHMDVLEAKDGVNTGALRITSKSSRFLALVMPTRE